jgi:hypothetical protein
MKSSVVHRSGSIRIRVGWSYSCNHGSTEQLIYTWPTLDFNQLTVLNPYCHWQDDFLPSGDGMAQKQRYTPSAALQHGGGVSMILNPLCISAAH